MNFSWIVALKIDQKNIEKSTRKQSFFGLQFGREKLLKSDPKWSQNRPNFVQDRQNCRKNRVGGPKSWSWDHLELLELLETGPSGDFWIFLAVLMPHAREPPDRYIDIDIYICLTFFVPRR